MERSGSFKLKSNLYEDSENFLTTRSFVAFAIKGGEVGQIKNN
jgi:hypothetical protein